MHTRIFLGIFTWKMTLLNFTYLEYVDGASHGSRNIASTTWIIFTLENQVLSSRGSLIEHATNNVVEYNVSIELLVEANTLGI